HELTKRLATGFHTVAIEDLNVAGMTARSAPKPDPDKEGAYLPNRRKAKSGLNRAILDVGFGEFRRQLDYKTSWHGSHLHVVDRYAATSKTCSGCGMVKAKLSLSERTYQCDACDLDMDRDLNAARNIRALALRDATPTEREQPAPAGVAASDTGAPAPPSLAEKTRPARVNRAREGPSTPIKRAA